MYVYRTILIPTLLSLFLATVLLGCAANLKPAPSARQVEGMPAAAVDTVNDIRVVTQPTTWPGNVDINEEVTPVRVLITNDSDRPLRVRVSEFALISPTGKHFSALPVWSIEGTVEQYRTPVGGKPNAYYTDFYVAPYSARNYPYLPKYTGKFDFDSLYHDRYYTYWQDVELPTPVMLREALPEGVLESGGKIEGWLFFEKVDDSVERLSFRTDLVCADSGQEIGEIRIPLVVE